MTVDLEQLERQAREVQEAPVPLVDYSIPVDSGDLLALVRAARGLQRCCEETDYCYACDCHPSHGHAADCPLR